MRLDSGDLCSLAQQVASLFRDSVSSYTAKFCPLDDFSKNMVAQLNIMASNEITVPLLLAMGDAGRFIGAFGIGTHLVTCLEQPALGAVYKLVQVEARPCMKVSEEPSKMNVPGSKNSFRLFNSRNCALVDVLVMDDEEPPQVGKPFLCHDPHSMARFRATPARVDAVLEQVWDRGSFIEVEPPLAYLNEARATYERQRSCMADSHFDLTAPTEYPVMLSSKLHEVMQRIWLVDGHVKDMR